LGRLPRESNIDMLRALTRRDLAPHFDPGGKIVLPVDVGLVPLYLTSTNLG
jgi:hypothetical protein